MIGSWILRLTLPNALSAARIVLAPVLLVLAWNGEKGWFLIVLALSLFTDAVDGAIARRLHQTSEAGSQLDSWGDFSNYMSIPLCVWWLWPDVVRQERWYILTSLASYIVPSLVAALKFKRMSGYHTWGSKLSAVLIGASVFFLLTGMTPWPFRLATPVLVLAALDDLAVTFILSSWRPNVASSIHALRAERKLRAAP
jgi:phosphatidylglycerophosphate synthase